MSTKSSIKYLDWGIFVIHIYYDCNDNKVWLEIQLGKWKSIFYMEIILLFPFYQNHRNKNFQETPPIETIEPIIPKRTSKVGFEFKPVKVPIKIFKIFIQYIPPYLQFYSSEYKEKGWENRVVGDYIILKEMEKNDRPRPIKTIK